MGTLPLRGLVDIQIGYGFRAGVEPDPAGLVGVIQMKDLGDDHIVDLASLVRVSMDVPAGRQVHEGDIILRSRGDRSTCAIVVGDPGPALVAAPLLRLRVVDDRLLSAYLNWYINQPSAQAHFARHAEGSLVKMISTQVLEDLEVEVPPLDRQEGIVALAALSQRERRLCSDIHAARGYLLTDIMMKYAKGSEVR
ncbi:MAG: restriction endonuclease subunit S [Actinomycetes bacterium]